MTEKAEGNALFAEEIVSFLTERGILRTVAGKVEFDANAVAAVLPASLQSLLTARVDRLSPRDRALLQAAAVIGRSFNSLLLAAVADDAGEIETRLAAMQALDLVHPEGKSGDYSFKHALVRDALYQSLLTRSRAALHLKIAEITEQRSGNRLTEVAEALALHYGQADRADKAFTYLAMAGAKSFGIYSLDEAEKFFRGAVTLLDLKPDCATDQQVADLVADYTSQSNLSLKFNLTAEIVERSTSRLRRLGDNARCVLVLHHHVFAAIYSIRYGEAEHAQSRMSAMAKRLGDTKSLAYSLCSAARF